MGKKLKLIVPMVMLGLVMHTAEAQDRNKRQRTTDRKESRLNNKSQRIDARNPNGLGRRDDRVDQKARRAGRKSNRTDNRVTRRRDKAKTIKES